MVVFPAPCIPSRVITTLSKGLRSTACRNFPTSPFTLKYCEAVLPVSLIFLILPMVGPGTNFFIGADELSWSTFFGVETFATAILLVLAEALGKSLFNVSFAGSGTFEIMMLFLARAILILSTLFFLIVCLYVSQPLVLKVHNYERVPALLDF